MHTEQPEARRAQARAEGWRAQEADMLAEIMAGLAAGSELATLLVRCLDPIVRLAGAQAGAVRVLSDSGDLLQLLGSVGLSAAVCASERGVDRHCGHCGAAADGNRVVWAADLHPCSLRTGGEFFGQGCRRLLAVPVQHHGQVLGVYNLFFADADEPSAEALAALRSIGKLFGLVLHSARLEQDHVRTTLNHERQMMAAEVHDSVAQSLAFVKMRLPLLEDAISAQDVSRARQYCEEVREAVTQAHSSLRSVLVHLRSPMDPEGLVHALDVTAQTFRRTSGAELDFVNEVPGLSFTPEQETQVFHIVREALTNVARHAHARHARVHLAPLNDGLLQVVIEDDGAGLPPSAAEGGAHYGLEIMLERARRLGGTLQVGPRDGGGTRVQLRFSVRGAEPARLTEASA
jgi:two-component system nitrate/nitrite sensor histidine kinase NarX